DKPMLTPFENNIRYIIERMATKRDSVSKWHHDKGPRIFKIFEINKEQALNCISNYCDENRFEVKCFNGDRFYIDLNLKEYNCQRWNLIRILCLRVISCMDNRDINLVLLVNKCNSKKTYGLIINPLNEPKAWKKTDHEPHTAPNYLGHNLVDQRD
ncbi:hypothetical protein PanWU01x14_217480, partial [Parasponia andersonii]